MIIKISEKRSPNEGLNLKRERKISETSSRDFQTRFNFRLAEAGGGGGEEDTSSTNRNLSAVLPEEPLMKAEEEDESN